MPAFDLDQGPCALARYDVVGKRGGDGEKFITHIGLYDEKNHAVEAGSKIRAVHMRPPLASDDSVEVHAAGRIPLKPEEISRIGQWIQKLHDEYQKANICDLRQYWIHPSQKDQRDPRTGVLRYRRYSCVGFVLDAYRQVRIELVDTDTEILPKISKEQIKSIYPFAREYPNALQRFGIKGDGPWPVVLPGYVLQAMNRPSDRIRANSYRPERGDEIF